MALKLIDTRSGKTYSGSGNTSSGRAPSWSSSSGKLNLVKTPGYVFNDPQVVYGDKRPDRIGASAPKLQFEEPIEVGQSFEAQMSRLAELRRQAAVDLDTALVDRLDRQMQALRTSAGKQTASDRVNDILSSALSSSVGSVVNAAGVGANAVIDPERNRRNLTRLQETLDKGYTTDGKKLNDVQKETLRQSIADLQKQLEKSQSKDSIQNKLYEAADKMTRDSAKFQSQAKQGLGTLGQFGVDVAIGGVQLATDIGLGAVTGLGALAPIAVRSFGGGAQEARQDGATLGQQMAYGIGSAAVELLTEKLSSVGVVQKTAFGAPILKDIDSMLEGVVAAIERAGKTEAGKAILNRLASAGVGFLSEGTEEMISGLVNPVLKKATYSTETIDWKQTWDDALYEFLVGGALGAIGGGIGGTDTTRSVDKASAASYNRNQTTVSPAAAPQVQQVAQEEQITRAVNPEAEVLSTGATLYTELGMRPNRAKEKAEIVQRLVAGEKVGVKDINKLNLTDKAYRNVFTQLTGVQFPEGRLSTEQVHNLARSAGAEALAAREAVEIQQQVQEKAFREEAQVRVEPAEQKNVAVEPESAADETVSFSEFMDAYRAQADPKVTREEAARQYEQYLNDAAERQAGATEKQRFVQTLRSVPGGDQLSDAEIEELFNQTQGITDHKEDNYGQTEDQVHRAGLHGLSDQRPRGQSRGVPGETGRAEGEGGARREDRAGRGVQEGSREESSSVPREVRQEEKRLSLESVARRVTLSDGTEALEVVREAYTTEMQEQAKKFAFLGIDVRVLVNGYPIPGTTLHADGVSFLGSETLLRANSFYGIDRIGDHELVHQVFHVDPELRVLVFEAFEESVTDEAFKRLLDAYAPSYQEAYKDSDNSMDDIIEEIVADAYAGIDRYDAGASQFQSAVRAVLDPWIQTKTATYRAELALTDDAGNLVVESNDTGYSKFSMSTFKDSGRDILSKWLDRAVVKGDLTQKDASDILNALDMVYEICDGYKEDYGPFSAWSEAKVVVNEKGDPVFSVVKANGDYAMNLDFSLVCKKRRTLDAVLNELVRRGFADNLALGQENIVRINDVIRDHGFETACALCFVDAKRFRQGKVADDFVKLYNDLVLSMVPKNSGLQPQYFNFGSSTLVADDGTGIHELPDAELDFTKIDKVLATKGEKTVEYKTAMLLKNSPADRKLTMRGDFLSTAGFDAINRQNPRVLKLFNAKKGSGGPKSAVSDVQYLNEVLTSKTFTPEKAYAVGGVRIQSFSDYVPRMVFDYVQMIADLSAKKMPAHAYTKEELFVKQFGLTGMKINMSLIPKVVDGGIAPGLDADGNYAWADESFDFEEAKKIQSAEGYSRNCGTIAVGVSDEHIRTLMADPDIRMVIPYHKSGLSPIVAKMNKIDQFVNYTDFQNTRRPNGKHGKKLNKDVSADEKLLEEHPDFNQRLHELGAAGDPRQVAEEYVRWCEEHDLLPKFDQFAYKQVDGVIVEKDGQRVVDENYYKLLEDFTVYDNGEYVAQTGLTMTFPDENDAFGSMADLIKRGLEEDAVLEGKREAEVGKIVDEIMKFSVAPNEIKWYNGENNTSEKEVLSNGRVEAGYRDRAAFEGDGTLHWEEVSPGNRRADERLSQFLARMGQSGAAVRREGHVRYGYLPVPVKDYSEYTKRFVAAMEQLREGDFFVHDGEIQWNHAGQTESATGIGATTKGGTIGVNNRADIDSMSMGPENTAAHEVIHRKFNRGTRAALDYRKTVVAQVNVQSPRFQRYFKAINLGYHNGTLNFGDALDRAEFFREFIAYVGGEIYSGEKDLSDMFEDYGAVCKALKKVLGVTELGRSSARASDEKSGAFDLPTQDAYARYSLSDSSSYAPTFYSKMEQVVQGVKQEKLGAASVVSMLRGKGVKAEEIKWSGIEPWLAGKKSVTKQELLEFIRANQLQIEQTELGDGKTIHYSDEQHAELDRLGDENMELWTKVSENWHALFHDEMPMEIMDSNNVYDRASRKLDAKGKGGTPEARAIREALRAIERNDEAVEAIIDEAKAQGGSARWKDYTLDGGENYREYLYRMPGSTYTNRAMKTHWKDRGEGILAHARVQDFINSFTGWQTLFIEEIQSDWHNEGRTAGYGKSLTTEEKASGKARAKETLMASETGLEVLKKIARHNGVSAEAYQTRGAEIGYEILEGDPHNTVAELLALYPYWMNSERMSVMNAYLEEIDRIDAKRVPEAPFSKNYHEFVLKDLIRKAAEGGYDSIGWTTGQIQEDRWSSDYAEGYRIEYDQDIPKFLSKYGKQWGAKVEKSTLEDGTEIWSMDITDAMRESVLWEGQPRYSIANPELSFADQVDLVRQNKLNEFLTPGTSGRNPHVLTNSAVYVAKEPNSLMQELGYGDLAIVVTQDHLRQMMGKREDADGNVVDEHNHQLTPRQVKILPKLLEKPAAVLRAKGRPESLIFVTTEKDYRGRPIIVPIKANGVEVVYDGTSGPGHVVTSMYGRDNFDTFFENAVKQGQLVYYKKERIDPILTAPGYQSSGLLSGIDSGTIVGEVNPVVKDPGQRKYAITPEFEEWFKGAYGVDLNDEQLKRRLETAERRAQEAESSKQAAETKRRVDAENDLTAWLIYHKKQMRAQKRTADAKLDEARREKTQAVRTAVAETKEVERAKAAVQHDADRMAERRNAAKRLRTKEDAYQQRVTDLKENVKLKRNAAKATLRDSNLTAKKRAAIETEQGLVDTIRKNPRERTAVEKRQSAAESLRTLGRTAYRNFVNQAVDIDLFSKRQVSDTRAGTLVTVLGGASSTVDHIFKTGLVNRAGDRIGGSMSEVFLCWDDAGKKVDEPKQALLQDYMLHAHNVDRMSFVSRARADLESFETENPWLRDLDTREFARLTAMTETEVEKTGKQQAHAKALEYANLLRRYNEAQDKPIFADSKGNAVTAKTSQQITKQYLAENPWLEEKAQGIYQWWDAFMREWAVGDSITETEYETMRKTYPHYVPTYRADKKGVGGANFVGMGGASVGKAVKKAKGGFSEVLNIEDSFANLVSKIVRLERTNALYKNIIDTVMLDTDGTFADMAAFDWDWQTGAYGSVLETGALLNGDLTDTVDSVDKTGLEQVGQDYKLTAWIDGRKYSAFISKELYKSIGNVTGHLANDFERGIIKTGNALTGPMKTAITGINPSFALRNISRDLPTAIVNSISGMAFPKYWAKAANEILHNSENWQRFQALGGTNATYYNDSKGFVSDMTSRNILKNARDKIGAFNELTESQTRFAEYLATIDRLGDTYEARLQGIKNSAEVTVDFSRKGRYGKIINAWVPYWNPAVQGIDKVVRSVIESPNGSAIWKQATRTVGRAAMTTVLFEAILYGVLKALDRDDEWEQLDDRTKDTYYCIPLKDSHTFLKIPKNREWGAILGTPFMRMLEYANGRENPFENYIETAIEPNFLPPAILRPDAGGGFATDAIGISQALDLAKNEDFAGRTIVPYAYQQGTLSQQFDNETSALAKKLGELFNWSPMQIDYIIGDYFGDFGDMFINATSEATWSGEQNIGETALEILTNPFLADARYSNASVSKYYDLMDDLGRVVQDKKNQMGTDAAKGTIEYQTEKAIDEMYGKQISELNRVVRELPDGTEKDNAKSQIAQLTKEAIEFYNDSMAGKVSNPILTATYNGYSESVAKELTRMDSYSEQYSFKPRTTAPTSYVDPKNKKNEYRLDDEQKDYFKRLYREQYDESFSKLIQSQKYRNAKDDKKAALLEDARDDVLDATKEEFFAWLKKNGVRSTPKAK